MENKSHAFAAGAFVLVVAALLVALAIWLTRDTVMHRDYELSTREAVTGLQPQAGVRFKGVTVGKVIKIGFDPATRGNVLIRISTDEGAPITRSTFATLGFQGVTGLAFIQLDDTGESKDALAVPDAGVARIPMRPGLLSKLTDQGTNLLAQVEETSRRLNTLLDADNQKILFSSVQGMGQAAQGIGQAATSIQQFSVNANKVLDAQFGPQRMNLPKLVAELNVTLKAMQATSTSVGDSADEAKDSAREFKLLSKSMTKPGGALEKLTDGGDALVSMGQSLNANTLPRLNRTSEEASRAVRQLGRAAGTVTDNPQALVFGHGAPQPGPGEAGFVPPGGKP
jgi:phospholipid/cholesterol/gamma-HCH transport system substrate-binding protein